MSGNTQPTTEFLLNGVAYDADGECRPKPPVQARWKPRLLIGILLIEACIAVPKYAQADFLSVFDKIFTSIQSDIGSSLKTINEISQQIQKLYQTTVAPLAAINQARYTFSRAIGSKG